MLRVCTSVHRASRLNAAVIRRICLARCCATCICARQQKCHAQSAIYLVLECHVCRGYLAGQCHALFLLLLCHTAASFLVDNA